MARQNCRIGVVAAGSPIEREVAPRVQRLAAERYGVHAPEIVFHEQCFMRAGHFAGSDAIRAGAFLSFANDPELDVIWFARGGHGAARIAESALERLEPAARRKVYMGYSDAGIILSGLYRAGIGSAVHGPMPADIVRERGEEAIARALDYLVLGKTEGLEPSLASDARPHLAFNLAILKSIMGTPFEPPLSGHVLLLEEVGESLQVIDQDLWSVSHNRSFGGLAGLRMGRTAPLSPDPYFAISTAQELAETWCAAAGVPLLGEADIGHDANNKIVPFGA